MKTIPKIPVIHIHEQLNWSQIDCFIARFFIYLLCLLFSICMKKRDWTTKMDPVKMETMESATSNKKSVINQMSTHVWNLFAKTNLFALCCVGAFLSLVRSTSIIWIDLFLLISDKKMIFLRPIISSWNRKKLLDNPFEFVWSEIRHVVHIKYILYILLYPYSHRPKIFEGKRTRLSKYIERETKQKNEAKQKETKNHFRFFMFNGLNTKRIRLLFCARNMLKAMKRSYATRRMRCQAMWLSVIHCLTLNSYRHTCTHSTCYMHTNLLCQFSVWTFEMSNCVGGLSTLCAVIRVRHRKIKIF